MTGGVADPMLAGLLADLREAHEALNRYLDASRQAPPPCESFAPWPESASDDALLTVEDAAERAGVSRDTIRRWCRLDKIGRLYGAKWRVSHSRLSARIGS